MTWLCRHPGVLGLQATPARCSAAVPAAVSSASSGQALGALAPRGGGGAPPATAGKMPALQGCRTERNSSPDNSAICDGLAASQKAAGAEKGTSHPALGSASITPRHLRQAPPPHQPLLRTARSYALNAFACVPFISSSA